MTCSPGPHIFEREGWLWIRIYKPCIRSWLLGLSGRTCQKLHVKPSICGCSIVVYARADALACQRLVDIQFSRLAELLEGSHFIISFPLSFLSFLKRRTEGWVCLRAWRKVWHRLARLMDITSPSRIIFSDLFPLSLLQDIAVVRQPCSREPIEV